MIAISLQLLTNLMGDPVGLPTTDGHIGKLFQCLDSFLKPGL
jgi:hypothetical protein